MLTIHLKPALVLIVVTMTILTTVHVDFDTISVTVLSYPCHYRISYEFVDCLISFALATYSFGVGRSAIGILIVFSIWNESINSMELKLEISGKR